MQYVVAVLMTTLAVGVTGQGGAKNDTCYRYDVDGCSIPFQLPFFYKELFTHSCARHDICYHCGVSYHIDRGTCDQGLRNDTDTACKRYYLSHEEPSSRLRRPASLEFKQRLVDVVDDHHDELVSLLGEELRKFKPSVSNPGASEFFNFFNYPRIFRVLIKWVESMEEDLSKLKKEDDVSTTAGESLGEETPTSEVVAENGICDMIRLTFPLYGVSLDCEGVGYLTCHVFSEVYYTGVKIFGGPNYHDTPEYYCSEEFVPKCLPGSPL